MQPVRVVTGDYRIKENRNKYNLPVNERLKKARNKMNLSSQQVVNMLKLKGINIGHSSLQGYEADEGSLNHRYPSIQTIIVLADFYGCSTDYLFGRTDVMRKPKKREIPDFKKELQSNRRVKWNGKTLTREQSDLISAQIEAILSSP